MRATIDRPSLYTRNFLLVTLSGLAYFTSFAMLVPVLPKYVKDVLGGGGVAIGLTAGVFAFSALILRPWVGILGDRRGRRLLMVSGAILVGIAVIGMIPSATLAPVIVLRLIAGAGEALFFVGAVTAVSDMAPPERRGEAVSLFSVALYAGVALGPLLGEAVLDVAGFDAVWLVSAVLCVATLAVAALVPDTRPDTTPPPASTTVRRVLHPAGLFPGVVMFTSVFGFAGFLTFIRLYAEQIGLGGAGAVLVMYGSILVAIRLFGARIPDRFGVERVGLVGLTLSAVGLATMGTWRDVAGLFLGAAVFAFGQALAFPAFMALAAGSAPPAERAAAVGTTTAFIDLGFGVGPIALGVVAASFGEQSTFLVSALVASGGIAIQLVARARRAAVPEIVGETG